MIIIIKNFFNSFLRSSLPLINRYKNNIKLSNKREYPMGPKVLKSFGTKRKNILSWYPVSKTVEEYPHGKPPKGK